MQHLPIIIFVGIIGFCLTNSLTTGIAESSSSSKQNRISYWNDRYDIIKCRIIPMSVDIGRHSGDDCPIAGRSKTSVSRYCSPDNRAELYLYARHDFQISFPSSDTSRNARYRHWRSSSLTRTNSKWHSLALLNTMTTHGRSDFIPIGDILPNSTFYRFMKGFHRTFAMDVTYWQGVLTPLDIRSLPIWILIMFYLLRQIIFPTCRNFVRNIHFEHLSIPSRFCAWLCSIFDTTFWWVRKKKVCKFDAKLGSAPFSGLMMDTPLYRCSGETGILRGRKVFLLKSG